MTSNTLKKMLLLVGVVLLAIAMWANINLYVSLASNPADKLTWATMGFAFDVAKILTLISIGVLWIVYEKPFAAMIGVLFWIVLTFASLASLFGYTSKVTHESERQAAINSMTYKAAQAALESSGQKLEAMSGYAGIDAAALQSQLDGLLKKKAGYEAELSACPKDYITKCIKPAQAKIQAVAAEIVPIQKQMDGYNQYQGVLASKDRALQDSKAALAGGASVETMHPMFIDGATLFRDFFSVEVTPNRLKVYFLALSALLCELLASFLLYVTAIMGGKNLHSLDTHKKEKESGDFQVAVQSPAPAPSQLTQADVDRIVNERIATLQLTAPKEVAESPK